MVAKASSRPTAAPSLPCRTRSATTAALGGQIEDDGVGGQIRRRRSRCGEREAAARRPATVRTAAAVAAGDDVGARGYARENNRQGDGRRMCVGPTVGQGFLAGGDTVGGRFFAEMAKI
uniref:DUF834 domain-containing protein n=1 Tax=Oryza rufipogon TaxID=4529 RepID=A0A0E0PN91_ORYRU